MARADIRCGKTVKSEVDAMSLWIDAKSPALKTEEAALLPALPRHRAGGAALNSVRQAGKRMEGMKLRAPDTAGIADRPAAQTQGAAIPAQNGRKRAALYQVWKR